MNGVKNIFDSLFNLGIGYQNTSLDTLRQRTINIFNVLFLTIMTLVVLIRILNGQLSIAFINSIAMGLISLALYLSYKGMLNAAITLSCSVLTLLTFALAYLGLLKLLHIVPQLALIMVTFIIVIKQKKIRYAYVFICLILFFLISLKHGYSASASIPLVIQAFGFAVAFNSFVNFLESQDQSLNSAISKLKQLNIKQEELNKTLSEKNEELTTFSHIMTHDLKSPLISIISFSKLIQRKVRFEEENIRKFFGLIVRSAASMQSLINDLLLYSKIESEGSSELTEIDLNVLMDELLSDHEYEITEQKVVFDVSELPEVSGHQQLIRTLFRNLISNAMKYQPKNKANHIPTISIHSFENKNYHFVIVRDNGIGIKEQYIENLFTPFKRFHTDSEYEGTGLGMSICKRVMQKHKGNIELMQTSTNGSSFKLTFKKSESTDHRGIRLRSVVNSPQSQDGYSPSTSTILRLSD